MSDDLEVHTPEGTPVVAAPTYGSPSEPDEGDDARAVEDPSLSLPRSGSLEARVALRRQTLEERYTEQFDVPGFEDLFRVELAPLSFKQLSKIAEKHQRVMNDEQRNLRTGADQLIAATRGFYAIVNDEGDVEVDESASWQSLYIGYLKAIGTPITDQVRMNTSPRAALIGLLGPTATMILAGQFFQWATSGKAAAEVESELARD